MKYLTEKTLTDFLSILSDDWIHNKTVPDSERKSRPDYRSEKLKVIVEFDGYQHYNSTARILADITNTEAYEKLGYRVIRIPYFIQLDQRTIKTLFGVDMDYTNGYPHGFISNTALLPCDFCELGLERFEKDLGVFSCVAEDIISSLKNKISEKEDIRLVLPSSLSHITRV